MTPQPVASVPKEIVPALAVNPPAPPQIDFSQLLQSGDSAPVQPAQGSTAAQASSSETTIHPWHAKYRHDEAEAANAAAALVPPALAQALPNKGAANAAAASGVPSSGSATQAALPVAAPQSNAGSNNNPNTGNGAGPDGQSTPQPPGAAELEARIVVGAPTYLSHTNNPALAGLLHHQDVGANGAADAPAGAGSSPEGSAGEDGTASLAAAKFEAAQEPPSLAALHAAANDASAAPEANGDGTALPSAADPAAAASTTAAAATTLPTPDGSTTQTAAAPQSSGAQPAVAAQALPAYEQVAVNLRQAAQAGTDRIEIQLKPASLGAIHVKLDVTHDGHISAVISADRSDTLNMLRQDSSGLTQALRDAGLQADSSSLSFNLRGDAQSFAQNQQSQSAGGPAPADDGASAQSGADTLQPRYRSHAGALDIEV